MNTADRLSFVLCFVIRTLLYAILRPLWLTDIQKFQRTLKRTNCYPCRVCYDLGEVRQMWIEDLQDIARAMDRMDAWEEAHA